MKATFRKLSSPILSSLEQGEGEFVYKPSHRTILLAVGTLFLLLSIGVLIAVLVSGQFGAALPFLVFFAVAVYCLVVGFLGTDRAVAKLWNSR